MQTTKKSIYEPNKIPYVQRLWTETAKNIQVGTLFWTQKMFIEKQKLIFCRKSMLPPFYSESKMYLFGNSVEEGDVWGN